MPRYEHDCKRCTFLGEWREYDLYFCEELFGPTVIARHDSEGPEYLSGIDFGESGMVLPLAHALALAKMRGLYRSKQERPLLPEAEKLLHLVRGRTGVHSDAREWIVRAFRDEDTATTYSNACQKKAELWLKVGDKYKTPPLGWSALDPKMQVDEIVLYDVISVPISLRPEEVASTWEICPICRGQMYDTVDGRICENGHEAV